MWKLIETVERLMKDYPYGSQMNKDSKNIVIPVKLLDIESWIKWRLSEYDPVSKIAFCYVTWFYEDEWWTVSIEELEKIRFRFDTNICRIEIDKNFKKSKFPDLPFNKRSSK